MRALRRLTIAGQHVSWVGITLAGLVVFATDCLADVEDARADAADAGLRRELTVQPKLSESQPVIATDTPNAKDPEQDSPGKASEESPLKDNANIKPFMPSEEIPAGGAVSFPADI